MNLRKVAKDQSCQVRLPGCRSGDGTTVLAHYRLAGYSGTSLKPPDIMGAWACGRCHDLVDFRAYLSNLTRAEIRLAHAEGVMRTMIELQKMGAL